MGGAESKNVMQSIIDNTVKTVVDISNNDSTHLAQGQYIDATTGEGSITISGVDMEQNAYVNLSSVSQMTNTVDIQNKITNELSQIAESLTKGINLGNFSSSQNDVSSLVQSSIESINKFSKTCLVDATQAQHVKAKTGSGDIVINTIKMKQVSNVMQQCMGSVMDNLGVKNQLDNVIAQKATAKTIGIDPLIVLLIILAVMVGGGVFLKSILPYVITLIAIVLIIVGVFFIVKYKDSLKSAAVWYGFTKGLNSEKYCSNELKIINKKERMTADEVEKKCLEDNTCSAADWSSSVSTFYSGNVSDECIKQLSTSTDAKFINVINPKFYASDSDPSDSQGKIGDIFINTSTGIVSKRREIGWVSVMDIAIKNFSVVCSNTDLVGSCDTSKGDCVYNAISVTCDDKRPTCLRIVDPYTFKKYVQVDGKWQTDQEAKSINGPGKVLVAKKPEELQEGAIWTCVKTNQNEKTKYYAGIGMVAGGAFFLLIGGIMIARMGKQTSVKSPVQSTASSSENATTVQQFMSRKPFYSKYRFI